MLAPSEVAGPLPVEVLPVVDELPLDELEVARDLPRVVDRVQVERRFSVLLTSKRGRKRWAVIRATLGNDVHGRRGDRLAHRGGLGDDRIVPRPDRQEQLGRKPEDRGQPRERVEPPARQDLRMHPDYKQGESRRDEQRHQMVAERQREQKDDQNQNVIVLTPAEVVAPAKDKPGDERDRHQAQCVDLFVHHRLVPDGERRGGDQRRGQGAQSPVELFIGEKGQDPVRDQEPERRCRGAVGRGEQIDLRGCGEREGSE